MPLRKHHHLILGGCSFIGRHVAVNLARLGQTVTLADRTSQNVQFPPDCADLISSTPFDLVSADWDALLRNADVVHHYAWTSIPATANADPARDLLLNVLPTLGLLEAARRKSSIRIIFSSSGGTVYGRLKQVPVREDHPLTPITGYGAGKVAAETYLQLYRELYGVDCRIARIANCYGTGQDVFRGQGAATRFLYNALKNEPIIIWGDGETIRDFVHVTDVANALVALSLSEDVVGDLNVFNVGSGHGVSLNAIIQELQGFLGKQLDVRREPARSFDVDISILDISRARQILKWEPRLTFRQGLARTLEDLSQDASISTTDTPIATAAAS